MAIDNLPNASDESRLSGAYIRSLVKQLTTSKPLNTNQNSTKNNATNQTVTTNKGMAKPNNHPQGHKKQVRRRLHTSRPYQERLLNMAEARKEIVTALKFHRAAMKQANEQRQKQQLEGQLVPQQSIFETFKVKHEIQNNIIEMDNFISNPSLHNNSNYNYNNNYWGICSSSSFNETLNIPLPNQTLGLNLNFQAFTNLDTNFCHSNNSISPNHSFSSSMSPSSSSSSLSTPRQVDRISKTTTTTTTTDFSHGMHPTLDEEEIAKMRSIGEQHQIEWDDTLDLMKSAWWFKYLKSVDFDKEIKREEQIYCKNNEEFMEFPAWLSANNDQSFLQQHLHDSCSDDTTLPWMDIGDIDGLDDEWLS